MFFFQAEDGIRDLVRSRGLGDVYKRQLMLIGGLNGHICENCVEQAYEIIHEELFDKEDSNCLLYTSDAADERSSVDLGGRRIIKKKSNKMTSRGRRLNSITK